MSYVKEIFICQHILCLSTISWMSLCSSEQGDPIHGATGLWYESKYIHKQIMNDKGSSQC